jgi:hypothetical protein
MTRPRSLIAVLVAAVALTAAGCGGGSDKDKVKSTVEDYLAAVTKGDGNKACSLVTDQTKKNIERGGRKCPETISALNKGPGRQVLQAFKDAKVENVKVTGDRATADIKVKSLTQKTNLRKEGGNWKLDSTGVGAGEAPAGPPPPCAGAPASSRATSWSSSSSSSPFPTASSSDAQNSMSRRPSPTSSSVSRSPASPESRRRMIASMRAAACS